MAIDFSIAGISQGGKDAIARLQLSGRLDDFIQQFRNFSNSGFNADQADAFARGIGFEPNSSDLRALAQSFGNAFGLDDNERNILFLSGNRGQITADRERLATARRESREGLGGAAQGSATRSALDMARKRKRQGVLATLLDNSQSNQTQKTGVLGGGL